MAFLNRALLAVVVAAAAVPAAAGGYDVDLPRLTFPETGVDSTRACTDLTSPTIAVCTPAK